MMEHFYHESTRIALMFQGEMKPVLDADYLNFNSSRASLKLERSGRKTKDAKTPAW